MKSISLLFFVVCFNSSFAMGAEFVRVGPEEARTLYEGIQVPLEHGTTPAGTPCTVSHDEAKTTITLKSGEQVSFSPNETQDALYSHVDRAYTHTLQLSDGPDAATSSILVVVRYFAIPADKLWVQVGIIPPGATRAIRCDMRQE